MLYEAGNEPLIALLESLVEAGVALEGLGGESEWDGSRLHVGLVVEGLRSSGAVQ